METLIYTITCFCSFFKQTVFYELKCSLVFSFVCSSRSQTVFYHNENDAFEKATNRSLQIKTSEYIFSSLLSYWKGLYTIIIQQYQHSLMFSLTMQKYLIYTQLINNTHSTVEVSNYLVQPLQASCDTLRSNFAAILVCILCLKYPVTLPSPTRAILALVKLFWTNWCSWRIKKQHQNCFNGFITTVRLDE